MKTITKILSSALALLASLARSPGEREALEAYLARSTDACDVEHRQREWERRLRDRSFH